MEFLIAVLLGIGGGVYGYLDGKGDDIPLGGKLSIHRNIYLAALLVVGWFLSTGADPWLVLIWAGAAWNLIANPNAYPGWPEWGDKEAGTSGARNWRIIPRYGVIPAVLAVPYFFFAPWAVDVSVAQGLVFAAWLSCIPGLAYWAAFRKGDPNDKFNRILEFNRGFWVVFATALIG